jgi:hypothetical protein
MSDTPSTPAPPPAEDPSAGPPPSEQPAASDAAPAAPATAKPRSPLALWAMIAGIVAIVNAVIPGLSFVAWIPAIAAITLGVIALIKKTSRRGQALTGVILGPIAWLVAIVVSIGLISGAGSRVADTVADSPAAVEEESEPVEEEPELEPEPEPEPEPAAPAADVVYEGTGDTILQIELPAGPDSIGIATITHNGSSNFAIWSLNEGLEQSDLLVNEIGTYRGTMPFNLSTSERTVALEISADGAWTVTLQDALTVREAPQGVTTTGTGDDVLLYFGDATIADIAHSGESNFAIWSYGNRSDLIVNEIGTYAGQVRWQAGSALIQISADGEWSIDLQ